MPRKSGNQNQYYKIRLPNPVTRGHDSRLLPNFFLHNALENSARKKEKKAFVSFYGKRDYNKAFCVISH